VAVFRSIRFFCLLILFVNFVLRLTLLLSCWKNTNKIRYFQMNVVKSIILQNATPFPVRVVSISTHPANEHLRLVMKDSRLHGATLNAVSALPGNIPPERWFEVSKFS
jgi:hypothetical protein